MDSKYLRTEYQKKGLLQANDLVQTAKVQLKPLMTDYFTFEDYNKANQYNEKKKDRIMKVLINVK